MIRRYLLALLESFQEPPVPKARIVRASPMQEAFASAKNDIGEREVPWGSNSGPYVEALRKEVRLPRLQGGEWCAVFCCAHTWRYGFRFRIRGARRLVNKAAKVGRVVTRADIEPGMCGFSLHKRKGGWHVRMWLCVEVEGELMIDYVGGNEKHAVRGGRFPIDAYVISSAKMVAL